VIRSQSLRDSAGHDDARCTFEIAGVCNPHTGRVLCHVRFPGAGGAGLKPNDTCAAIGCCACHDVFDGRVRGLERGSADWYFYAIRAIDRTTAFWIEHGFLSLAA
jgi:hypothetical protein